MNAQTKIEPPTLAKLREPFAPNHISKLPKPTKAQNDAVKADFKKGKRCTECGGWHHPEVVHLDYVGHAALTDRLLDTDPEWTWEPVSFGPDGLPALDRNGGLWIRLTVLGVTRLGYGDADGKSGGNAVKEAIGDALRNAAMRFGAALDLWHKGDLHADEHSEEPSVDQQRREPALITEPQWAKIVDLLKATGANADTILTHFKVKNLKQLTDAQAIKVINQLEDKLAALAKAETNRAGQADSRPADHGGARTAEFGDLTDADVPF